MSSETPLFRACALPVVVTLCSIGGLWSGCASSAPAGESPAPEPTASAAPAPSASAAAGVGELGGRLFDKWYDGKPFKPDDGKTPAADGTGGPFANGRLKGADGKELQDDAGHQTRLKNLFGWDLRGAEGIYGAKYQKKKYVLPIDLLTVEATRDQMIQWFTSGHEGIPAYGDVLAPAEIGELVDFIMAVRDGRLPRPDQVFELSTTAAGNYTLRAGGDAARGTSLIKERCASCHGEDGTTVLFDDGAFSLGMHARQKGYEDWMKILNGQPGTAMGRQVQGTDGAAMAKEILDILAALCDRKAFPKGGAKEADVADGDARCGSYLR